MEIGEAYRVLEVAPGATKELVREARNVLAKVWHPDRHQSDPKLHDRAAAKLLAINQAYAVIEDANFPPAPQPPRREAPPAYVDTIHPRATAPQPVAAPPPAARRRMLVPFLLGASVAAGVFAFVLNRQSSAATPQPPPQPPITAPAPSGALITPSGAGLPVSSARFTLGSTRDDVRRIQGPPTSTDETFGERWSYGMAEVEFTQGKVSAWRSSAFDHLNATMIAEDPRAAATARTRGTYGPHASRDEVLGVEGSPDGVDFTFGETWNYGMSNVKFDKDGRIATVWNTSTDPLKITK